MSLARAALAVLDRTGAFTLLDATLGSGGIVAYHAVTTEPFLPNMHITAARLAEQLEFLAARYTVIPLKDYVARRRAGRSLRSCAAVTFDDAYSGILELALPHLERLQTPATVFVATGYPESRRYYWWDRAGWVALRGSPEMRASVLESMTGSPATPDNAILPAVQKRTAGRPVPAAEDALERAERTIGAPPVRALSREELVRLGRSDLIDFGCHTESHPALPYLSPAEQEREMAASWHWLEAHLPRAQRMVAYPYGLYSATTLEAARRAGMTAGFSLTGRAATFRFGLYSCPRIGMAEVNSLLSLRAHLSWPAAPLIALRNREWHPRVPGPATPPIPSA